MARTIADLLVRIGADTSELRKELNATKRQINSAFGSSAIGFSETLVAGAAAAGAALAGLGVYAVKLAGQFESTQVAFTNMLGSAEKATALTKDLQEFAAKTPFDFKGLAQSSQKLLAFGFTAEQIIPTMTAIGDAASGLGGSQEIINRITLALGQMAAKGRVQSDEMLQLTEAGIPAWQMLADTIGTSIPEAMDKVKQGAVDAQTGLVALTTGMEQRFGGMMEEQSKTIAGSWSNLMDSMEATAITTGLAISDALNLPDLFNGLADSLSEFNKTLQTSGIGAALKALIPPELRPTIAAVSGVIIGAMVPALITLGTTAAATLIPLLPYIAIGAAIGLAIYAILDPAGAFVNLLQLMGINAGAAQTILNKLRGMFTDMFNPTVNLDYAVNGLADAFPVLGGAIRDLWGAFNALFGWIDTAASKITWLKSLMDGINKQPLGKFGMFVNPVGTLIGAGTSILVSGLNEQEAAAKEALTDSSLDVTMKTNPESDTPKMPDFPQFGGASGAGGGSSGGGERSICRSQGSQAAC